MIALLGGVAVVAGVGRKILVPVAEAMAVLLVAVTTIAISLTVQGPVAEGVATVVLASMNSFSRESLTLSTL